MSRWFRFYADAMRNPKVASLSDYQFRLWVQLLAVASENDGIIPNEGVLKSVIRVRLDHLLRGLNGLITVGLIDPLDGHYTPHNWSKFQYKSDTSTDRVTLHRKNTVTPPETDTDTETETDKKLLAKSSNGGYVFNGRVIKLNQADFDRWQKANSRIDLMSQLQARDDWLWLQDERVKKNWFNSTSNWLAQKSDVSNPNKGWELPIC